MHKILSLFAGSLLLSANLAIADTNWTNFQGNAAHTGYIPVKTNPVNIKNLWQHTFNLEVPNDKRLPANVFFYHGMVIVDGTAYFTMSEFFHVSNKSNDLYSAAALIAVDLKTGEMKWQQLLGDHHQALPPLYENGKIFVIELNEETDTYQLIAYDADSGKEDYRTAIAGADDVLGSVAANGSLYSKWFNMDNVDERTGKLNWSKPYSIRVKDIFSIPAVTDKYIIQNGLDMLDITDAKTGDPLFQINADHAYYDQVFTKLVVYDAARNTAYQGFRDTTGHSWSSLYAFDLTTKQVKWVSANDISQPVLAGNEIYTMGNSSDTGNNMNKMILQSINADTGKTKWTWQSRNTDRFYAHNNIVATDDVVFIPFQNSTVAVSRQTHDMVWESKQTGSPVISNDTLVLSTVNTQKHGVELAGFALR